MARLHGLNPKLLAVGGGAALLFLALGGLVVWLWPAAPAQAPRPAAPAVAAVSNTDAGAPPGAAGSAAVGVADAASAPAHAARAADPSEPMAATRAVAADDAAPTAASRVSATDEAAPTAAPRAIASGHSAPTAATGTMAPGPAAAEMAVTANAVQRIDAGGPGGPGSHGGPDRGAASTPVAAAAAPPASAAQAEGTAGDPAPPPSPAAPAVKAAELPLDRLQRRLGEVLGARGAVDAAQPGEWRVLTRASAAPSAPDKAVASARDSQRPAGAPEWSHSGMTGPQAWARLHPDFAACANGRRQSPIDIRGGLALDLEPIRFDYRPGGFGVVDNGHTVQVDVAPGSAIELQGRRYLLQHVQFRRPSEERIAGRRYEMSAHFMHRDAEGRVAVVAVMLERGAEQPLLRTLWRHLPLEKGEQVLPRIPLDPAGLLPQDRRYYSYMGSLTTPPCSEGVLWLVLKQPVAVSPRQIDVFSRLYPMNARPLQPSGGRLIQQSN